MEKLARQLQFLRNNHYIQDAVILLSGNGLKIFIGFISNVILAKFFGAEKLAIYGTLMAVALLSVNITDFGFGNTLNQLANRHRSSQKEIFSNIFILKLSLLILFLLAFYQVRNIITNNLASLQGSHDLVQILIISVGCESLFKFLLSSLQAKHLFKRFSLLLILNNSVRLIGIVLLYLFKLLTLKTLLFLYIFSFSFLIFTNFKVWSFTFQLKLKMINKICNYAIWVWSFIIFNTLFTKADVLLVNYLHYEKTVIGNYVLILFFISLISLLQEAIFTQLLPKTSDFHTKNDFEQYYADIKYIRIGAICLSLIYILILPFLLKIIYANQYQIDNFVVFIFGLPFLFSLYNEFNGVLLYAIEKHRYISMGNILGLIAIAMALFTFRSETTVLHVVLAVIIGKLVVESFIYLKVKQCLRLISN